MQHKLLAREITEYISSLLLIVLDPRRLIEDRVIAKIPNILLGLITMLLFSVAKYQVVSGIIMFKTLKMLVTLFPQYSFLTYYASYVNAWGVFLGVLVDLLLLLSFTLLFYSGIRLLGIRHSFTSSLTITSYSWIADVVVVVAGLIALPLDIISSALILVIALIVSILLKAFIVMNAYVAVFNTRWINVFAVFTITIIILGLIIIGVIMV